MQTGYGRQIHYNHIYMGLLGTAYLVIAGVAFFAYWSYQNAISNLVIERDRELILLSASRLKEELNKYSEILHSLARNPDFSSDNGAVKTSALKKAGFRLDVFDGGVLHLDNFGRVVASKPEQAQLLGLDFSDQPYFSELLSGVSVYYSNIIEDGPNGPDVVVISVPVIGENGQFNGALAGMFNVGDSAVSAFYASIVRLRLGQSGSTYVVDGDGLLLYQSSLPAGQESPYPGPLSWLTINSPNGALRTRDEVGNDIVAAYALVPGTEWTLISEDDWAIMAGNVLPYGQLLLGILTIGMVIPGLGIILLMRLQRLDLGRRTSLLEESEMTNRFQQMMVPRQIPILPGWQIKVNYRSSQAMRTDFHDLMVLPDGKLMIVIGRVEGNGMVCTFNIASLRAIFRSMGSLSLPPAEAMAHCNALIAGELQEGTKVRCLYAVLDPLTGRLVHVPAGLQAPIIGGKPQQGQHTIDGHPLGEDWEAIYRQIETTIQYGECALMFSGEFSGLPRTGTPPTLMDTFFEIASQSPSEETGYFASINEGLEVIQGKFNGGKLDFTLIALERQPAKPSTADKMKILTRRV